MTKVYISLLGASHYTTIVVNGRDKRIHFSGAERDENGIYVTGNKAEQEAIEKNKAYGKAYKLQKELDDTLYELPPMKGPGTASEGTLDTEAIIEANLAKQATINPPDPPKEVLTPEGDVLKEISFRNIIMAQEFFGKAPYSVPKSKIRTQVEVQAKGKELGFNVVFISK